MYFSSEARFVTHDSPLLGCFSCSGPQKLLDKICQLLTFFVSGSSYTAPSILARLSAA